MNRVLILGSNGMLGHVVLHTLKEPEGDIEVFTTSRNRNQKRNGYFFDPIVDIHQIGKILREVRPDYVVNCIGQLVQGSLSKPKDAIVLNSLLPHYVASLSSDLNFRFIHVSTDCVFNGQYGPYKESDSKTEDNYYGLSKNLGEIIHYKNCMTIRTSIIGPEIRENKTGLFEWVLSQNNRSAKGFKNVIWSGVTTIELSKFIQALILGESSFVDGLIHATNNEPINKYDLVKLIIKIFDLDIDLNEDFEKKSNKQLINTKELNFEFNSYRVMIEQMMEWCQDNEKLYVKS